MDAPPDAPPDDVTPFDMAVRRLWSILQFEKDGKNRARADACKEMRAKICQALDAPPSAVGWSSLRAARGAVAQLKSAPGESAGGDGGNQPVLKPGRRTSAATGPINFDQFQLAMTDVAEHFAEKLGEGHGGRDVTFEYTLLDAIATNEAFSLERVPRDFVRDLPGMPGTLAIAGLGTPWWDAAGEQDVHWAIAATIASAASLAPHLVTVVDHRIVRDGTAAFINYTLRGVALATSETGKMFLSKLARRLVNDTPALCATLKDALVAAVEQSGERCDAEFKTAEAGLLALQSSLPGLRERLRAAVAEAHEGFEPQLVVAEQGVLEACPERAVLWR